ncbi:MAG: RsmB/NOP family class I SAM-dependent RNA methyltransferase [Saprospiraceae bacterium]|nr:RsmB/NOP family class I SAM-dependent RNA methyltransferase [Saprospiraceae bacterium]
MALSNAFKEQMKTILGEESDLFFQTVAENQPPTSIRWNPSKAFSLPENNDTVKWNNDGVYLEERPTFTLDPLFHGGAYYVQEASSMFLAYALRQINKLSEPQKVLDLCAAPGGKSTLLSSLLPTDSLLLSNEVIQSRFQILKENMTKWGAINSCLSRHDSKDFKELTDFFDLIIVDAPCSGEGLFRKDPKASDEWSPENVQLCTGRQKRILAEAVKMLQVGGTLIYCTCTFNHKENEDNAAWLMNEFGLEHVSLEIPSDWPIEKRRQGYQFYPHRVKGEGFYIACLQKPGAPTPATKKKKHQKTSALNLLSKKQVATLQNWVESDQALSFSIDQKFRVYAFYKTHKEWIEKLSTSLYHFVPGLHIGDLKNNKFIPAHGLAMSQIAHPDIPKVVMEKQQALHYLKKEVPTINIIPRDWAIVQYEGINLGWIKGLKNRYNNYYPKEWRIRMRIT